MSSPKAIQTFLDLEIARCNERYNDIPELTRRYKKYHPYESVLEFTAKMEAEFILLLRQARQEKGQETMPSTPTSPNPSQVDLSTNTNNKQKRVTRQLNSNVTSSTNLTTVNSISFKKPSLETSDAIHQFDDPSNVVIPVHLEAAEVQLILVRLLDVIQRQIKSGELETPDDWQAQFSKIILARIYFETKRYDKTLEWLQQLALRTQDVESGYGLVLLVQARVLKGICYESQENDVDALDSYLAALEVAEKHPDEENKALSYWLEDCIYRSVLLQLRKKGPVKQTLKLMRTYLNYCCTVWPSDWRIYKRWVVFRHYIRYLTRAYQKGVYVPATPQDEYVASPIMSPTRSVFSDTGETTLFERSAAALDEIMQLITQFRHLLATFAPLLITANPIDLNHRTLELSNLLVSAHETVGWGPPEYIQRTLKYFTRTRKFTFNSLCTTRHIFYTLVRVEQMGEAKRALLHYLELLGLPDFFDHEFSVETLQARLLDINLGSSLSAASLNFPDIEREGEPTTKKKPPTGSCESDTEFDVVRLVLSATQHLYMQQGQEAAMLTDLAVAILNECDLLRKKKASQWKSLMTRAKRLGGTAYGVFATQCQDEEKRSEYLLESLSLLKRATELDSRSWQAFYQLGLQQAITGDLVSATSALKRSIKLRGDFIPSWHLLALIQSSRQYNHSLASSLQLIQAGLAYHLNMVDNEDNEDIVENILLDTEEGKVFFDRAEAYMKLRMSQAVILEELEGPEAVLKVYPDLFDMYAKLSKKMHLEKTATVFRKPSSLHETVRSRPRSRANSSVHSLFEEVSSLDSGFALEDHNESRPTLNKVVEETKEQEEQEDEEEEEEEDFVPKSRKKHRRSFNLSRQLMDDPLMSFPINSNKKKEKIKSTTGKRSTFLGIKRSESSSASTTKKELKDEVASSSLKEMSRQNSSSNNTVKSAIPSSSIISLTNQVNVNLRAFEDRWQALLVQIWVMTSATYALAQRFEDAHKAIMEADVLTSGLDAHVWHQIGKNSLHEGNQDRAIDAFKRALSIDPEHIATHISLSSVYLSMRQFELVEQLLERSTKGLGWNETESW
ncbi:hypothetical protein INT47_005130 [Mucor saturninus]|uniref:TPR-like protein n=1 Tax=Mucor saturninus TaxID=64648 RepID=A0A8H7QSM4_9FUNG|nr:hypothetical protein INT47_005130 [Mucor saturninus]